MSQLDAPLDVVVDRSDRGMVARVIGPASLINVDDLTRALTKLSAQRPKLVVFDLSGCPFICSLAIGSLMEFHRGLKSHGGEVRFAGLNELMQTAFRKLNLQHVFRLHPTADEALAGERA